MSSSTASSMDVRTWDLVLPRGLGRTEGEPPPAPEDWEERYVLPVHSHKPLQSMNAHPLDADLVFFEKPHVYAWQNVPTSLSVTALAHEFEKDFVPTAAIASMKTSRSQAWPRLEYVVDARSNHALPWSPERGLILSSDGRTIASLPPHSMSSTSTGEDARRVAWELVPKGSVH